MLAIAGAGAKEIEHPIIEVNLSEKQKNILLGFLKILNQCKEELVSTLIENAKEKIDLNLGIALLYSISQNLPIAYKRLWANGADFYHNHRFRIGACGIRLDLVTNISVTTKSGTKAASSSDGDCLTLFSAASAALNFALFQKTDEIEANQALLKVLLSQNVEWSEHNIQGLVGPLVHAPLPPETESCLLSAVLQSNLIRLITRPNYSILHEAILSPKHHLLETFLGHPDIHASIDSLYQGFTPLHLAAFNGNNSAVTLLISHGANLESADKDEGATALYIAAAKGRYKIVKALLRAGANVNAKTIEGATPLHIAASYGYTIYFGPKPTDYKKPTAKPEDLTKYHKTMQHLIDFHADCTAENARGQTPAYYAATVHNLDALALLLEKSSTLKSFTSGSSIDAALLFWSETSDNTVKNLPNFTILQTLLYNGERRQFKHREIEVLMMKKSDDRVVANFAILYWLSGGSNASDEYIIAIRRGETTKLQELLKVGHSLDGEWLFEALVNAIVFQKNTLAELLLNAGANAQGEFHNYNLLEIAGISGGENPLALAELAELLINNNALDAPGATLPKGIFEKHHIQRLKRALQSHKDDIKARAASTAADTATLLAETGTAAGAGVFTVAAVSVSITKAITPKVKIDEDYISRLLNNIDDELNYIRQHLREGEFFEANDSLDLFFSLLQKLMPFKDHNRTWENAYNRYCNQYHALRERIEKHLLRHASATPPSSTAKATAKSGTPLESTVLSTAPTEESASAAPSSTKDYAQLDFTQRIAKHFTKIVSSSEKEQRSAHFGMHYNLIRLFELWSSQNKGTGAMYWTRQHLLHRYFDPKPEELALFAQDIVRDRKESLMAIEKTRYYQLFVRTAPHFNDDRKPQEIQSDIYQTLLSLAEVTQDISPHEAQDCTDAARFLVLKLGELLRDSNQLNAFRSKLIISVGDKVATNAFCDDVCHARNVVCHTHNIKIDPVTKTPVVQERLSLGFLKKLGAEAARIAALIKEDLSPAIDSSTAGIATIMLPLTAKSAHLKNAALTTSAAT